ncbi:MarR family winged helix-turn-helix transcriptional regulator [Microlunatus soli]|uniref:DNA-binding transcriptional regulator, MarR family n=1 Tax=Microlunatus soli TaxID=630515 RepID=A0A1H1ZQL5_9ACTN|nr:MarR family transcriptional regulator [Microlunatus soli]SDT36018.1 DNA-binding transcriptional regulator, MarR family [Microlunatus soli]
MTQQEPGIDLRLGGQFYLAHRFARAGTNGRLRSLGLDLRHLAVLRELADNGPSKQRALVDRIKMDRSSLVYVIDELERQGLAERGRDETDRRSHAVRITAKGRRRLTAATAAADQAMRELLSGLTATDKVRLEQLLDKVISAVTDV